MDASTLHTFETILYICTFVTTISAALNVVMAWYNKAKTPERNQNKRIYDLEQEVTNIKSQITEDEKRISLIETTGKTNNEAIASLQESVEKLNLYLKESEKKMERLTVGEKVTQRAILALISHELNNDDGSSLSEARDRLNEYLLEK